MDREPTEHGMPIPFPERGEDGVAALAARAVEPLPSSRWLAFREPATAAVPHNSSENLLDDPDARSDNSEIISM
jgi:hypothetical protein